MAWEDGTFIAPLECGTGGEKECGGLSADIGRYCNKLADV